jgi:hypothetical protein
MAPLARFCLAIGAYQSLLGMSWGPYAIMRSNPSWPRSTRANTSAASEALKLLHMTKRSSGRQASFAPVVRFSA